ncbi:MAG: phosphoribosylformimino-5-aminoimidazole carboxamide ribotide isomerase [Anaerovoracaceae bacterium]
MRFRPCIDIHNGSVKQIVGSSLRDDGDRADENFVSEYDSAYYAELYKSDGLKGGHIILLNPEGSEYYEADCRQALLALETYPGGFQVGGGINAANASDFIKAGASHVIVTSYVFEDGRLNMENLLRLTEAVGKEHIVLDLSCRKRDDRYFIVTDRWQKFTDIEVTHEILDRLSGYCDEFLIHGVDVEGKSAGVDEDLIRLLGSWEGIPVTYAGGIRNFSDLARMKELAGDRLDVTIGSALSIFGGSMNYDTVVVYCK